MSTPQLRRHIPRGGGGPWGRLLAVAVQLIARGALGAACVQQPAASRCAARQHLDSAHPEKRSRDPLAQQ
ncbi:hypothetical protein EYF80_041914 [Liparis tanakae]|uniref:Uncharacterized protein n=1 Tax=Liparis tanakae TaxID=230148 RepID=A0A4Z2G4U9_9TELE|nr:hypothetical protein EYF80_041914 [Liparis tanakae]